MKYLALSVLVLAYAITAFADDYRLVVLQHRDALALQKQLDVLTGEDVTVGVDGNKLLLRGPSAELERLQALIKQMDKPQQQLAVLVYRGVDPGIATAPYSDQRWSTNSGRSNRYDSATIRDGSTLRITDNELVVVPVEEFVQESVDMPSISTSKNKSRDAEYRNRTLFQRNDYSVFEYGIELTASLLGDRVSISGVFSEPVAEAGTTGPLMRRTVETRITRTVDMDEWVSLSSHDKEARRPELDGRHVYSIRKAADQEHTIWIKFQRVQ
jgi:hypothetical protein